MTEYKSKPLNQRLWQCARSSSKDIDDRQCRLWLASVLQFREQIWGWSGKLASRFEPIRSSSVKLTEKVKGESEASNSHSKPLYARTSRIKSAPAVRSQFRYSPLGQTKKKETFYFRKVWRATSTSSPGERLTGESIESVRLRCPEPCPGWIWLGKTLFTLC